MALASSERPAPISPAMPTHLALADRQADIVDLVRWSGRSPSSSVSPELQLSRREQVGDVAPDHELGDALLARAGRRRIVDQPAVAQHDDAVGELDDLVQPVRDVDDRSAIGAQAGGSPSNRRRASSSVSDEVGSSKAISRPPARTARMISIICRCAGPSVAQSWRGAHVALHAEGREHAVRALFKRAPIEQDAAKSGMSPTKMFSATVRLGTISGSWWMTRMPAAWLSRGSSKTIGAPSWLTTAAVRAGTRLRGCASSSTCRRRSRRPAPAVRPAGTPATRRRAPARRRSASRRARAQRIRSASKPAPDDRPIRESATGPVEAVRPLQSHGQEHQGQSLAL